MPDLAKARVEIEHSIGILRSRYHYDHPIFDHLANALAALVEEPVAVGTPVVESPEAEEKVAGEIAEPTEEPARRAGKRG